MKTINPTPERSVEEIVEELRNKILDIETAVRLTYNEKDSDQIIDKLLTHYTQTLQAERQKREEMVEAERERIYNYLVTRDLPDEDGCSPVLTAREMAVELKQALTQPNNPK